MSRHPLLSPDRLSRALGRQASYLYRRQHAWLELRLNLLRGRGRGLGLGLGPAFSEESSGAGSGVGRDERGERVGGGE